MSDEEMFESRLRDKDRKVIKANRATHKLRRRFRRLLKAARNAQEALTTLETRWGRITEQPGSLPVPYPGKKSLKQLKRTIREVQDD